MDQPEVRALLLIPTVGMLAPLLVAGLGRFVRVPLVVFEIVLGIIIGPDVTGWLQVSPTISSLSDLGVAMLFFMAGNEIDFARIKGRPLNRSIAGWFISLVVGVAVGLLLAPTAATGVVVGICLTSTALGTLMPILRDAGELQTPFGSTIIAIGAVGEFGPLVAISLFLSGRDPGPETVILIGFTIIAAGAIALAGRGAHPRMHRLITATLRTSGQFAIRLVMVILFGLVALSIAVGLDMLLGAFTAGVVARLLFSRAGPHDLEFVEAKLEAVAFGFLVPIFFITTGMTFDLQALLSSPSTLLLVPIILVLLLVVRGLPGLLSAPIGSGRRDRIATLLFSATGLPIIVAVTKIGAEAGVLTTGTAAALVGAGMLSVLLFPLLALGQHARTRTTRPPDVDPTVVEEG